MPLPTRDLWVLPPVLRFRGLTDEGAFLIELLQLNEDPALAVRKKYQRILEQYVSTPNEPRHRELFLDSFAYPSDLPDIKSMCRGGRNLNTPSEDHSFHEKRKRGDLAAYY